MGEIRKLTSAKDSSHIYNFAFSSSYIKKEKGEKFNNIFYSTQYMQVIIISPWNQHLKIEIFYSSFFHIQSLKSKYFILIAHLSLDQLHF